MGDLIARRKRWARKLITLASRPVPAYGSPEWLDLPEGDPRKVAAVVICAEARATEADELAITLWQEIGHLCAAFKAEEDRAYVERRDAHRDEWARPPPSFPAYTQHFFLFLRGKVPMRITQTDIAQLDDHTVKRLVLQLRSDDSDRAPGAFFRAMTDALIVALRERHRIVGLAETDLLNDPDDEGELVPDVPEAGD